ncbi:MAG: Secretion system C-terminal sorting domain [Bacteroidota bacterium]
MAYFCLVKHRLQHWFLAILLLLSSAAQAQRFQIEHEDHSDSVVWFVRNTGPRWVKPTSMTINWFHTKPNLYVWDANPGPASYRNRITEINKNGNLTFKYKSTQGVGISDTLYPGQRIPVFYSVNYNTTKTDTIMPANGILFYHDSLVRDGEESVLPKGASCSYERIYLKSYAKTSNVHYRSPVWFSIAQDVCQKYAITPDLFILVVFDQKTFKPTSAGVIPKCPSGRYGTAFGYPKDSIVYYSFTLNDGPHIDSIINGITDGDYVALVSYPTFSQYSISKMKSRFAPIGLNTDSLIVGPFGQPDVQMVFWGRKGLASNKGRLNTAGRFFKPPGGSIVSLGADHVMITNQATDQLAAWPPCFDVLAVVHQPYIPAPIKIGTKTLTAPLAVLAYPNPAQSQISLETPTPVRWHFTDAMGRPVTANTSESTATTQQTLDVAHWSAGVYFGWSEGIAGNTSPRYRTQFVKIP